MLKTEMPNLKSIYLRKGQRILQKEYKTLKKLKQSTQQMSQPSNQKTSQTISADAADSLLSQGVQEVELLWGQKINDIVEFTENGIKFTANINRGQKTGFFFDQRENRERTRKLVQQIVQQSKRNNLNKARVLNLFSYTGAFSVYAGLAGASEVISVDVSQGAIQDANKHWLLNKLNPKAHLGVVADVFSLLSNQRQKNELTKTGKQLFDLIIVDPPSMISSSKTKQNGISAYKKLVESSVAMLDSNGIIGFSSCSSHLRMNEFYDICSQTLAYTVKRKNIQCIGIHQNPIDHPTLLMTPELQYLKFLFFKVNTDV